MKLCHICEEADGEFWSCCSAYVDASRGTGWGTGCDHEDGEPTCEACGAKQGWWPATSWYVRHYEADGCSPADTDDTLGPFETPEEAAECVRELLDGQDFGYWIDDDGQTCYHESADECCGGFCISQAGP